MEVDDVTLDKGREAQVRRALLLRFTGPKQKQKIQKLQPLLFVQEVDMVCA